MAKLGVGHIIDIALEFSRASFPQGIVLDTKSRNIQSI